MIVRNLRPDDMNAVMTLMNYYCDEINVGEDWDESKVIQTVRRYSSNVHHICLVAMEGQRAVGIALGSLVEESYNDNLNGLIEVLFLLPSHRTDENYIQIFNELKNWSTLLKNKRIGIIDWGNNPERLIPIINILGFTRTDFSLYDKELKYVV